MEKGKLYSLIEKASSEERVRTKFISFNARKPHLNDNIDSILEENISREELNRRTNTWRYHLSMILTHPESRNRLTYDRTFEILTLYEDKEIRKCLDGRTDIFPTISIKPEEKEEIQLLPPSRGINYIPPALYCTMFKQNEKVSIIPEPEMDKWKGFSPKQTNLFNRVKKNKIPKEVWGGWFSVEEASNLVLPLWARYETSYERYPCRQRYP